VAKNSTDDKLFKKKNISLYVADDKQASWKWILIDDDTIILKNFGSLKNVVANARIICLMTEEDVLEVPDRVVQNISITLYKKVE